MTVLALILICIAVTLVVISRVLSTKYVQTRQNLPHSLQDVSNVDIEERELSDQEAWDAMWDEAEEAIDQDVYRLLNTASVGFRWGAIGLAIAAVIIFVTSLL